MNTLQELPPTNDWREVVNKGPLPPGSSSGTPPKGMFYAASLYSRVGLSSSYPQWHSAWCCILDRLSPLPCFTSVCSFPLFWGNHQINYLDSKLWRRLSAYWETQTKIRALPPRIGPWSQGQEAGEKQVKRSEPNLGGMGIFNAWN